MRSIFRFEHTFVAEVSRFTYMYIRLGRTSEYFGIFKQIQAKSAWQSSKSFGRAAQNPVGTTNPRAFILIADFEVMDGNLHALDSESVDVSSKMFRKGKSQEPLLLTSCCLQSTMSAPHSYSLRVLYSSILYITIPLRCALMWQKWHNGMLCFSQRPWLRMSLKSFASFLRIQPWADRLGLMQSPFRLGRTPPIEIRKQIEVAWQEYANCFEDFEDCDQLKRFWKQYGSTIKSMDNLAEKKG